MAFAQGLGREGRMKTGGRCLVWEGAKLWHWEARQGDAEKARAVGLAPVVPWLWKALMAQAACACISIYDGACNGPRFKHYLQAHYFAQI